MDNARNQSARAYSLMQLYGDTTYELDAAEIANAILRHFSSARGLSELRSGLIWCGQLEQLLEDCAAPEEICRTARAATDHAASVFYGSWASLNPGAPVPTWSQAQELEQLRAVLAQLCRTRALRGKLKIPEGFAFYALYPEQYCAAAVAYLRRRPASERTVHVIGLRSIGTTLSAAVCAVLRAAAVQCLRYTVRPHGDPFRRELTLNWRAERGLPERALVVDEGPGLSGSSIFSVARALERAGVPRAAQAYICAHAQGPGKMASPDIVEFWRQAERYAAANYESNIGPDGNLRATLQAHVSRHYNGSLSGFVFIAGGAWRAWAYESSERWPAAYPAFERPKWLAELSDGRRVLLKYYGQVLLPHSVRPLLGSADAAALKGIAANAREAFQSHGYVGRLWREGRLLSRADKSPATLSALLAFLASRPWHPGNERGAAADTHFGCSGRLAPHEWLAGPNGDLLKLPETLQGYDHTAIDREPLGWDLAAAAIEWELDGNELSWLLQEFAARTKLQVSRAALTLFRSKYAGFRAEMARFCAEQASDPDALRLRAEAARYLRHAHRANS